jgi:FtsZ-binding cell division protein ZapB
MDSVMTTDPMTELEVTLRARQQALGKISDQLEDATLDGAGTAELEEKVLTLEKEIDDLKRKKRALERRAAHATQEEKAAAKQRRDAIIQNVAGQIADLMAEGGGHVRTLKDYGARLTAALNAGQSLDDEVLRFQCNKIRLSFRVFLLHSVQQFPGCNLGLAPFMGLDAKRFEDLAPTVGTKKT